MDKLRQIELLKNYLTKRGIAYDTVDLEAEVDETLQYEENFNHIQELMEEIVTPKQEQLSQLKAEDEKYGQQELEFNTQQLDDHIIDNKCVLPFLFKNKRGLGLVGNTGVGKSLLALDQLIKLKEIYPAMNVRVFGVEKKLYPYLKKCGIGVIHNSEDILNLKLRDTILFIDEFGDLFSSDAKDKQGKKLVKFFNRLDHLNNYIIIGTARNGFWNKFMNGFITSFLVKEIDYDHLINGTHLKRKVMGFETTSDYCLEMEKEYFYIINDELTMKGRFEYNPNLDSKKDNISLFSKKAEKFPEKKADEKAGTKPERKDENLGDWGAEW